MLVLTVVMAACSGGGGTGNGTSASTAGNAGESGPNGEELEYDSNGFLVDSLPTLNYNGRDFRVLYPTEYIEEFFYEEESSDLVEEAVHKSNLSVAERLNLNWQVTNVAGVDFSARDPFANTVLGAYATNDDLWDVVGISISCVTPVLTGGAFIDLLSTPYLDFAKPWWLSDLTENATINGRLYLAAGDAGTSLLKNTNCLLYNMLYANDLQIPDLQQTVLDGKWTKELWQQYVRQAFSAVDEANPNLESDSFGFATRNDNHLEVFKAAFHYPMLSRNNDGTFTFIYDTRRASDSCEWLCSFANNQPGTYLARTADDVTKVENAFRARRMLFVSAVFADPVDTFNDIAEDFGILPYPKWAEDEEYATLPRGIYVSFGIMRTAPDSEFASAALEAVASQNYRAVTPIYFEDALKIKYTDATPETKAIFDLIRSSTTFDFGYTFSANFGLDAAIRETVYNNLPYWTSLVSSTRTSFMNKLSDFLEQISALEDYEE